MTTPYKELVEALRDRLSAHKLIDDPLRLLAYGSDASFYRLIPQLVVRPDNEEELMGVLAECRHRRLPVTFRTAGTSLSGQAVTDSVLIQLNQGWRDYRVLDEGRAIRLQPGIIGARANQLLAPYGRKIGPDPASINSCMIGGIAANNASGMCCGTAQNSYRTLRDMRVILADGTLLDTGDTASRSAFRASHGELLEALEALGRETRVNTPLAERIRHKYRLKNTTGYALNSLIDFEDGCDILAHLMIGSEGTLGFISAITYDTVPDAPLKTAALALFPDMATACRATLALKSAPVSAVELMDRAALRAVEGAPGMPAGLEALPADATALLIDVRDEEESALEARIDAVHAALEGLKTLEPLGFTRDPELYARYWKVRKGLFPAVGAVRDVGTTVIIEDVAFPLEHLETGVAALTETFRRHGYDDAILFGHALEGNLHFVFPQGFETPAEVQRYADLMDDVATLVADEYGGSLKAEHGTGRNMAPFVEREWGAEAYALMWQIKALFDAENLLNPDVILSRDAELHLHNLKPLPAADPIVDKCIECGFCEPVCPSRELTLTPRQRIVIQREMSRLESMETPASTARLKTLREAYQYQGIDTCAADGLCATQCPVGINTGDLVREWRHRRVVERGGTARLVGRHFSGTTRIGRGALRLADTAHGVLGSAAMGGLTRGARRLSGERLPQWIPSLPAPAPVRILERRAGKPAASKRDKVVYLPACATRVFGTSRGDDEGDAVTRTTLALLEKAGYEVVIPAMIGHLCCGMAFQSRGYFDEADHKARELNRELLLASQNGRYPVLCDTSPCTQRMVERLDTRLTIQEPVAFAHDYLLARLAVTPKHARIALHVTCSSVRMGLSDKFVALAEACADDVVVPAEIACCGFAGDKGFTTPELSAAALRGLADAVNGCEVGYSNSRTCEMGLSHHAGIPYRSILDLLNEVSRPRTVESVVT
ncbi:FAD-binding and (Fe-S)-binding domain-containing protein [Chromohalobacter sarecensis]|uniref:D-lactate dehydrogenase (cytochrome) n=1 Tax=Chromohalobacter sarecensis TaxID=245294 RepID=A0ABV9D281_9GAMM|nr:FAD-binding and (Fe-S)-binding domain-containing protein [Chromohalobacter sarecensis]MCK0715382.1 FAD-binding oxidoreductase [Chromohalobacter sarecensis]